MRTVDLFAGCGGFTLGLQREGFRIVCAVDNWQPAIDIYKLNFNHMVMNLDLSNVEESVNQLSKLDFDLIVGGPPCQDFSHAGKRNENGGRASLTVAFAEIISQIKPEFFVMENVDQITKFSTYKKAIRLFQEGGYKLHKETLNASYFAVPQRRKRHFVIGHFNAQEDDFLQPYIQKRRHHREMTLKKKLGHVLNFEHYYRHPRNYDRRGVFSVEEPSPTVRGVNRPIPAGYPSHPIDTEKDLNKVRPLTTRERALIQGFGENFQFRGSRTNIEQVIGNAVPVGLARVVGAALLEYQLDVKSGVAQVPVRNRQIPLSDLVTT